MARRTNILDAFRRQRHRLGRVVAGLFAVAWFTMLGVPCFGMPDARADTAEREPALQTLTHEHVGHHGHAQEQGASEHAAGHDDDAPQPLPCPHCPLHAAMPGHVPSSVHTLCSSSDDVVDKTSFGASLQLAKHVLSGASFAAPPPLVYHPPPRHSARAIGSERSAIALNLRNCVFLI